MKYIYYDIECSDGFHMCSFGYVVADENFNVLEKEDILMNPEAIFHTGAWGKNREKDPGIELGYPKEVFRKSPKFPKHYQKIRALLTDENAKIIGFSHNNDALFLTKACKRYSLPTISYRFFDVQDMYGELFDKKNQVALNTIAEDLNVDLTGFVMHRSDEDSLITMLVAKALAEKEGVGIEELIRKCPLSHGEVTPQGRCVYYVREQRRREKWKNAHRRSEHMNDTNLKEFRRYLSSLSPDPELKQLFLNRNVTLDSGYEYANYRGTCLIAAEIIRRGGRYVRMGSEADTYIKASEKKCYRLPYIKRSEEHGKQVDFLTLQDFMRMTGITEEDLENAPFPIFEGAVKIAKIPQVDGADEAAQPDKSDGKLVTKKNANRRRRTRRRRPRTDTTANNTAENSASASAED